MRATNPVPGARPPGCSGPETVLSAAEALWPAPASSWLGRRADTVVAGGRNTTYAVVPAVRRPRYLVPTAPAAAVALRPVQGGVKGMRMTALSRLQRLSLLHRLPGRRLHVLPGRPGAGIEDLLGSVVGEVAHVVVRLGRPRPNRTLVVWALGADGPPLAIAKVSRGEVARQAMEGEYATLVTSPARGVPDLVAPRVLGYVHWHDNDVLVISALVSPGAGPSHEPPVPQMKALARSVGVADLPLRDTPFLHRLARDIDGLGPVGDRAWLRHALEVLLRDLGSTVVRTGAWHGDWVSWNQALDGERVLLWDWEHYAESALAGFDHAHFLAQELRARGTGARAEDAWLAQADAALDHEWGFGPDQRLAVLRGYLIEVNLRYVRDRRHEDDAPARVGWARGLVERLAGTSGP